MNTQYDMIYADSRSMHVIHQSSSSHPHAFVKLQQAVTERSQRRGHCLDRPKSVPLNQFTSSKELRIIESQVMDP